MTQLIYSSFTTDLKTKLPFIELSKLIQGTVCISPLQGDGTSAWHIRAYGKNWYVRKGSGSGF